MRADGTGRRWAGAQAVVHEIESTARTTHDLHGLRIALGLGSEVPTPAMLEHQRIFDSMSSVPLGDRMIRPALSEALSARDFQRATDSPASGGRPKLMDWASFVCSLRDAAPTQFSIREIVHIASALGVDPNAVDPFSEQSVGSAIARIEQLRHRHIRCP